MKSTQDSQPHKSRSSWIRKVYSSALILGATILILSRWAVRILFTEGNTSKASLTTTGDDDWHWLDIVPSRELVWHQCFKDYDCARLDVPLDWLNPSDDARAIIAVIRLPASDKSDYRGPVFTNPGGPGGSGVFAVRDHGKYIQKIVGQNYDIISFDPRGVGASSPRIQCWPSIQSKKIWGLQHAGVVDSHPGILYDAFARASAHSEACALSMGGAQQDNYLSSAAEDAVMRAGPLKYVSTISVARDMLEISEKAGYEKLRYWGFSYGTVLGGVFAANWPEKVERLVSDGNVDYEEWFSDSHVNFLSDADKVLEAFYHLCHASGPSTCAFHASSPSAIEARLDALLERLKKHPIIVPGPLRSSDLPEIITYSSLKRMVSSALYRPVYMFPAFAKVLAALEGGQGSPFLDLNEAFGLWEPFKYECDNGDNLIRPPETEEGNDDAFKAVLCADGGQTNESIAEMEDYTDALIKKSKASGAVNVNFKISCAGWTVKSKWMFNGPFTGNTSFPILYINNEADNVTPLRSAHNNAKGFPNSTILIQESYGHTSLSTPSTCTASHIHAYFQNGTVPDFETRCKADVAPFEANLDVVEAVFINGENHELSSAVWDLARRWKPIYTS